jgi:hypothetical protein
MASRNGTMMRLAALLFCTFLSAGAYGQEAPLKIEIKTTQPIVRNAQEFSVSTKIENTGVEEQVLRISQCAYSSMQWTADNPLVHVKDIFCKKNAICFIRLHPGQAYERPLPVRIDAPAQELLKPVTFRLGFRLLGELISAKSHPLPQRSSAPGTLIWSNSVTVNVRR